MRECKRCKVITPEEGFRIRKGKRQTVCGCCISETRRAEYLRNKEHILAKKGSYYESNRDARLSYMKQRYEKNRDSLKAKSSAYFKIKYEQNKEFYKKKAADRIALLESRALTSIEEVRTTVTKLKRPGLDVDHIIPIKGKLVSGLHVPWNLQAIPTEKNRSKGNKFDNESYQTWRKLHIEAPYIP